MSMKPLIIGVAGGSGSGKSTVARNVAGALGEASVAFLDMDAYYLDHSHLPFEQRKAVNWDHPNAFDWDLLVRQLADLSKARAIEKPVYDFHAHVRSNIVVQVPPADDIVIDWILILVDKRVRDLCDVNVFVDANTDIRLIRRIRRDMSKLGLPLAEILEQYL